MAIISLGQQEPLGAPAQQRRLVRINTNPQTDAGIGSRQTDRLDKPNVNNYFHKFY